ncbi:hemolysin D [Desulfuromonas versatilis]|uniref:Hemolysin D n=1 Tax=Desulfuromonas versatilis TaxID=2802975 RepID=A0ABM8HWS1_9BACT|nr:efflux RND transporter periplasmic adaptor subunit [Desulfuromonas versatilis]BCR06463.1 hemolysin D [Desulfuromonas versatilis]
MPDSEIKQTGPTSQQASPLARALRLLLPVAVLGAGVAIALWLLETKPQAKPRPQGRNATLVEVRPVLFGPQATRIEAMGTVKAAREVQLRPQVSGEILEISADLIPGGHFREGQRLLRIDPTDYRLALRQLSSEVAKVESELQMEQGNQLVAQREFELLGEAVSPEEKSLMLRQPQLQTLRASLEAARAKLEQAGIDLKRTEIEAPFNAVVMSREVNLGARVTPTSTLATLVGTDEYWVEVSVPVSQLRWIRVPRGQSEQGSLVRVYDRAAWGEGVYRQGRVIRLAAGLEEQGRMARLLVRVEDPLNLKTENAGQRAMLLNSYVRVEIEGEQLPSAAAIERGLIRDGDSVWVMDGEGRLEIRPVTIAFRGSEQVLVSAGLTPEDRLVVSDLPAPVAGMALRLNGEPGTAPERTAAAPSQAAPAVEARP